MAVPAHDERDYAFARKYDLPIREVVSGGRVEEEAYTGDGTLVHSAGEDVSLDGLSVEAAKARIIDWLEAAGHGERKVNYRLRDWLFSRQRYWGEPVPLVFREDGEAVPVAGLPVELPDVESYAPVGTGQSPLAGIDDWVRTTDPATGAPAVRETNTMPQWAGSCWYYLRFIDPHNDEALVDPEKEAYWMPVDLYVGGSEHAVLHLLYARFWHMVLYDAGVVSTEEPFRKLVHQGMILGEMEFTAYVAVEEDEAAPTDAHQPTYVSAAHVEADANGHLADARTGAPVTPRTVAKGEVEKQGDAFVLVAHPGVQVDARSHKMSKSRGNVVNPDDVVDDYGADALRLYEMFMGPLEQVKPWSTSDVDGVFRFLNRVWRLLLDEETHAATVTDRAPTREENRRLHETIQKVTGDIETMSFNTAIAAMMAFVNDANKWADVPRAVAEPFVLLLSPFAPHLAEEVWQRLGHDASLAYEAWPVVDEDALVRDTVEMAVQVNGTVRATIEVDADAEEAAVLAEAKAQENVARHLEGATIRREIYVPGRIVNFVAK